MKRKLPKVLLCQRCRTRKVKCNFEFPCSQCVKAKTECVQTVDDMRKKRPGVNYVTTLQTKLDRALEFINLLKNLLPGERQRLLDVFDPELDTDDHDHKHNDDENDERGVVYGPTSVFRDETLNRRTLPPPASTNLELVALLTKDPEVLHCLKLFFTWQYPDHNMFIFREAFLIDFFNSDDDDRRRSLTSYDAVRPNKARYCSQVLVWAICALGARMLEDESIYTKSLTFYKRAKLMLLDNLARPLITLLQAFLLLAFYDICLGNNSSGWMMSGNAIRMGYDLGFQLNPEVWFVKGNDGDLLPIDMQIRLRIYWGAYMADHFISLVLGRPSFLKLNDATIAETDDLPDLEWIDDYTYSGYIGRSHHGDTKYVRLKDLLYISNPLNNIIYLINISDLMLADVFTKPETDSDQEFDVVTRLSQLGEYNEKIMQWKKELPPDLQWDRAFLRQLAENPTLTYIRYYYYILLLCLNRPFLGMFLKANKPAIRGALPLEICNEAIEDLYVALDRFRQTHGLRRCLIFMVYCLILAISIILLTHPLNKLASLPTGERLQFFMEILRGSSKTWKLADKSYQLISIKLHQLMEENQEEANTPAQTMGYYAPYSTYSSPPPPPAPFPDMNNNRPAISNLVNPVVLSNLLMLNANMVPSLDNASLLQATGENLDFLGGPPMLMTSDLFNEDWEQLFPDYGFNK